ncbi:hypothetical protein RMCBS344292_03410 [Rhizopus microsporus]|nr:hypothetical protein RMCBS344292_03410 [Rhizopus microsporus]
MDGAALIQNTVKNDHSEAVTDSSNVLQSEVSSETGGRTDELLTGIRSVCRQASESRIRLTSENNNRLSQIYNETKTVVVSK